MLQITPGTLDFFENDWPLRPPTNHLSIPMQFVIKLFPEISIKSRPVRKRFVRQLRKNIRSIMKTLDPEVTVVGEWDIIEVQVSSQELQKSAADFVEKLVAIPGIDSVQEVVKQPLPDMDGIYELCMKYYGEKLKGKTFAVRCKRTGRHAFKSVDVERYVGGGLNQHTGASGVKLVNPDITVRLEIRHDELFLIKDKHAGLGGYPLGCQDSVLSLISGGFDSSVSSYLCMRRGLLTHYCFFNLGGRAHELAVKEVALFLWMKYHSTHRVKFVSVPFEGLVEEILDKVDNSQMGVVLKRMMLRAAENVAEQLDIHALVTGESVAQVSSQTLPNLSVIDSAIDALVLRPLATSDKQDIIDKARAIGTEEFSKNIPEYCAVISRKPTTRAKLARIEREESYFDFSILDAAVKNAKHQLISDVVADLSEESAAVEVVTEVAENDTVIDIRHPNEIESHPLSLKGLNTSAELLSIPFYQLRTDFTTLEKSRRFLLYCDKGLMSRLHAANLLDEGFKNVAVLEL